MPKKKCVVVVAGWTLVGLLFLAVGGMAATFPLSIPTRPTSFPLSTPARAGSVVAWGNNSYGQTNVPPGLTNVVAVAGGEYHTVALKQDGTVIAWGDGRYGQTNLPASLTGVVALGAGANHTLALKQDGAVVAWGINDTSQTSVPTGLSSVVAVAGGQGHSVVLKKDGMVVAWGANAYDVTNVPPGLTNVVAIAAGKYHCVALTQDGAVAAWGDNSHGQTNVPPGLTNVVAVAAGLGHSVVLKENGTVVAWGINDTGQTNVPSGLTNVVAVAAGVGQHTMAVKEDGTLVVWGNNSYGQKNVPPGLSNVIAIAAGLGHGVVLEAVERTGDNYNPLIRAGGVPVTGSSVTNRRPVQVSLESVFAGGSIFYTLDAASPSASLLPYVGPFTVKKSAVLRAITFSADFAKSEEVSIEVIIQPTLTLTTDGGGSVAVSPAEGPWPADSMASVTATPADGRIFLGWLGDDSRTNASITVAMNRNKCLKAVFGTTLTLTPAGAGSILCDAATPRVPYGSTVRLTAVPLAGNYFLSWGGFVSGAANPMSLVITNTTPSVSAVFVGLPVGRRALTVSARGAGHVNVSSNALYYTNGTVLTLTAVPDQGQAFLGWSGDGSGNQASLPVTLNSNKVVTANFSGTFQLNLSPLDGMTPDGFRASFAGQLGAAYTLLASTNLETWEPVGTMTNRLGTVQMNDPLATNSRARFYRAVALP